MYRVVTSDFLKVMVTNSANSKTCLDRKFAKDITIRDLKGQLEMVTGGSAATMKLEVYEREGDRLVCKLEDDNALLGSYPINDEMRLHVVDSCVLATAFETEEVEKFNLSAEEYAKRSGTVKDFLSKNKLGKYNEEEMKKREAEKQAQKEAEENAVKAMKVGDRCEVAIDNAPTRRGTVMYVGELDGKSGLFVGVKYDEPLGKNDGMFEGKRYFQCPPKYGGFVRCTTVKVGDFPEEEYGLDEF